MLFPLLRVSASFSRLFSIRSYTMYEHITVSVSGGVQVITLNRPEKRNAVSVEMYHEIPKALAAGTVDNNVVVTVITGAGKFYSSGNDMSSYLSWSGGNMTEIVEEAADRVEQFVRAFICYPKILVAVINGPAIGIAATTLALFDLTYASDQAYLETPFTKLGLSPEGCSSYTFPKIMGANRASQMLCFNKRVSAHEAFEWGLISEIYSDGGEKQVWDKINSLAELPSKSLIFSKRLLRSQDRAALLEANVRECELLKERWQSEDCMNAIVNFFNRNKGKL